MGFERVGAAETGLVSASEVEGALAGRGEGRLVVPEREGKRGWTSAREGKNDAGEGGPDDGARLVKDFLGTSRRGVGREG